MSSALRGRVVLGAEGVWWVVLWRSAFVSAGLGGALAALQVLRMGPVVVESGAAIWSVLALIVWGVGGLMVAAVPAGWLFGALLTFRERQRWGEWLAWRASGHGWAAMAARVVGVGLVGSLVSGVFAFGLGPWGLERVGEALAEVYIVGRLAASPRTPVPMGGGLWVAAAHARVDAHGAVEVEDVWAVHSGRGAVLRASRGRWDGGRWELEEARSRIGALQGQHRRVVIEAPSGAAGAEGVGRWLRYVPEVERTSTAALVAAGRGGDGRARRALAKRLGLSLAPAALVVLAFPLAVRWRRGGEGAGAGVIGLVTVVLGAGWFGLMRAGELWGGDGLGASAPCVLPAAVASALALALWWRPRLWW